jgi:hypothetical protein
VKIRLYDIRSDYQSFAQLINIAEKTKKCIFDTIEIDMVNANWLDANMCAAFGAILYKVERKTNTVNLVNLQKGVETILSKNGFLSHYGREKKLDTYGTTIEYKMFKRQEDQSFASYVEKNLVGKGIPKMSQGLRKKFFESMFEIFSNAASHSRTKMGIFSCGQFFPRMNHLDFSVTDLGVGIQQNVNEYTRQVLTAEQAINWAMEGNNTTKVGQIPGGLGLKILREFIIMNQGKIQIVSDKGYWELSDGKVYMKAFSEPFPGTTVNIEINTADTNSYCLSSEIRSEDVF